MNTNFNPYLVGIQLTDPNDSSILTLANFAFSNTNPINAPYIPDTAPIDKIDTGKRYVFPSNIVFSDTDYSYIGRYIYYGSFYEQIKNAINEIILSYPVSLHVSNIFDGNTYLSVINYRYDSISNRSYFEVPAIILNDRYGIIYSEDEDVPENTNNERNLIYRFLDYDIYVPLSDSSFAVSSFTPSTKKNDGFLIFEAIGNPFNQAPNGNTSLSISFHVRPNKAKYEAFFDDVRTSKQKYLMHHILKNRTSLGYEFSFFIPDYVLSDDTSIGTFSKLDFIWEVSDGYNIDVMTVSFDSMMARLLDVAGRYDTAELSQMFNRYIPKNLSEYDYTRGFSNELQTLTLLYGMSFDLLKNDILNLKHIKNISYDNIDNPTSNIFPLLLSELSLDFDIYSEADIYRMKMLLLNSMSILRRKGTREGLDMMYRFLGFDSSQYTIEEYVYTYDDIIARGNVYQNFKYDDETGRMNISENSDTFYFEMDGYYDEISEIINLQVDNRKIWTDDTEKDGYRDDCVSQYIARDVLNTKLLFHGIDPARQLENTIYEINRIPIMCDTDFDLLGLFQPQSTYEERTFDENIAFFPVFIGDYQMGTYFPEYPINKYAKFSAFDYNFDRFIQNIGRTFINATNRKGSPSYSSIERLFHRYIDIDEDFCGVPIDKYDYDSILSYIDKIQFSSVLPSKMIPKTTKDYSGGIIVRNTKFHLSKHQWKRGIDEGCIFQTDNDAKYFEETYIIRTSLFGNAVSILDTDTWSDLVENVKDIYTSKKTESIETDYDFYGNNGTPIGLKTEQLPSGKWYVLPI